MAVVVVLLLLVVVVVVIVVVVVSSRLVSSQTKHKQTKEDCATSCIAAYTLILCTRVTHES